MQVTESNLHAVNRILKTAHKEIYIYTGISDAPYVNIKARLENAQNAVDTLKKSLAELETVLDNTEIHG